MTDIERMTAAIAKMRQPEIRLNPADYRLLPLRTAPSVPEILAATFGISVAADASVPVGEMMVIERFVPFVPFAFKAPEMPEAERRAMTVEERFDLGGEG
jgi:hypothetical protein